MRLVGTGRLQRLLFSFHRLLLLAEFRHATAQLLQTHQAFLISTQQAVHALLQPCLFPLQPLLALLQRIGLPGCF